MISAIGSSSAEQVKVQLEDVTKAVTQGETEKTDNALKIVKAQVQQNISNEKSQTVEDALSQLLG